MSKGRKALLILTIMLSSIVLSADFILMPLVNDVFGIFADYPSAVNWIVSGAFALSIVCSPIAGKLCNKYSKKTILILGAVVSTIFAFGVMFSTNVWVWCFARALNAVGYAFTKTAVQALLVEVFIDEKVCDRLVGYYGAAETGAGAILSFCAGHLSASISFEAAMMLHMGILVYLVCVILFVPSYQSEHSLAASETVGTSAGSKALGFVFWLLLANFVIYGVAVSINTYYVSVYVAENALGTEAMSGTMTSLNTLTGFFMGLVFASLYERIRKYFLLIFQTGALIAFFLLSQFPSTAIAYICSIMIGGCFSMAGSYVFRTVAKHVEEERRDFALSMVPAAASLGACSVTYICSFLGSAFGIVQANQFYMVSVVLIAVCLLSDLVLIKKNV